MPMTVRDAVEATLVGRDVRLMQRCDVACIVAALEGYGCYDVPMLMDTLESSFGELQTEVGTAAAPAFLALLKAYLRKLADSTPPSTPQGAPPSTPSTGAPPSSSSVPPVEPAPTTLPVIITVKFNGKTVAERSSLPLLPTTTWEEAAHAAARCLCRHVRDWLLLWQALQVQRASRAIARQLRLVWSRAPHHMCASENRWLKWIGDESVEGRKCFDCWLLEALLKQAVHPVQLDLPCSRHSVSLSHRVAATAAPQPHPHNGG